jgi:tRNA pseudouridine55 synthase
MKTRYQLNKLDFDEFGRPSGLLLINKPAGITSHDVVDRVRALLHYKKVGHAGALDVFSSGLLLILVGKATKLSNELLSQDKAYLARVILGIATETQDPEGRVLADRPGLEFVESELTKGLTSFLGGYEQYVSPFSSVKVGGKKLRKVLRDPNFSYQIVNRDQGRFIVLEPKNDSGNIIEIAIPKRQIGIMEIRLDKYGKITSGELPYQKLEPGREYFFADIYVKCSKGTYIRQLAEDLGAVLKAPASLSSLQRTALGENQLEDAIPYPDLETLLAAQKP